MLTTLASGAWRRLRSLDPGFGLAVLLALFAVWSSLPPGLPHSADVSLHINRTIELDQLWRAGVFYQRWAPDLALGYGYPLWDFYAPLYYYAGESLHFFLGLDYAGSLSAVNLLAIVLHGVGMYGFLRGVFGARPALLGAAAYLYAPIGFYWLFTVGMYPQVLAYAFLPFSLWAFRELMVSGQRRYVGPAVLSLAAIVLSHNLTALLFLPVLGAYLVFLTAAIRANATSAPTTAWPRGPALSVLALLLAGGMTSFFWFPALYDLQWVQSSSLVTGYFDISKHFLSLTELFAPSVPLDTGGHNPYQPYNLGLVQSVLALAGLGWVAVQVARRKLGSAIQAAHAGFFVLVLAACVFLMLPVSQGMYDALPLIRFVQFPWRLLGIAGLGTAGLAAIAIRIWPWKGADVLLAVLILGVVAEAAVFTYPARPFRTFDGATIADVVADEARTGNIGTTGGNEYLPVSVTHFPGSSPLLAAYARGEAPDRLDRAGIPAATSVARLPGSPSELSYQVEGAETFSARFFLFYFPGWEAQVDGAGAALTPEAGTGFVTVPVAAGRHTLRLVWRELPHRLAADIVSIASLIALALLAWQRRRLASAAASAPGEPAVAGRRTVALLAGVILVVFVVKIGWIDARTSLFRAQSPVGQVLGCPHPLRAELDGQVALICHDAGDQTVRPGDTIWVTTYWLALAALDRTYGSFLSLVAADGRVWASATNENPGNMPTTGWQGNLYVRDVHDMIVPADAPPVSYSLRTGLYDVKTGRRLSTVSTQGVASDAVALANVRIKSSREPDLRGLPQGPVARFGDCLNLVAYRWNSAGASVSREASVTLFWRAECPVDGNYTVSAQLLDAGNRIGGQQDAWPVGGLFPTSRFPVGEVVEDRHDIAASTDAPGGDYDLAISLYRLETMQRLPISGSPDARPDHALVLQPAIHIN